jgi:hypothetical protein
MLGGEPARVFTCTAARVENISADIVFLGKTTTAQS